MKVWILLSFFVLTGCSSNSIQPDREVRTPAQVVPSESAGSQGGSHNVSDVVIPEKIGPVTDPELRLYAGKLCQVIDLVKGDRRGTCLGTLNAVLSSKFDSNAASPSRSAITTLVCEVVPQKQVLKDFDVVRYYCFKNAFFISASESERPKGKSCGELVGRRGMDPSVMDPKAKALGDCYKRELMALLQGKGS